VSLKDAAVGPIDVQKWLADIKAGKVAPRTAEAEVYLDVDIARQYDELVDRYNRLATASKEAVEAGGADRLASDPAEPYAAELDALEVQIADLQTQVGAVTVKFVFRGYRDGDQAAIRAKLEEFGGAGDRNEKASIVGIAHYSVDPVLTPDDVVAMLPVIGFAQFDYLATTYQRLVYGAPTGPKSLKPSRIRETAKR
jgi:hypothetical protein